MKTFKQYVQEDYIEEGITKDLIKDLGKILLGKSNFHKLKRAAHADKYKIAVEKLRQYKTDVRKAGGPEAWAKKNGLTRPGMTTTPMGIESMIKGWAADFAGINHKEFNAILDRKTRYEDVNEGSESWEAGYKRRVVKTTKPEHKEKGYNWRIKGKDRPEISIKLYKEKPSYAEFTKQMKRVAGHEFGSR